MTKVGLFGGTFDPPHMGHLKVALAVLKSGRVDQVWFLPCWKHAFSKEPTAFEHRVNMCRLVTGDNLKLYTCPDEGKVKSTYSIEILEYIKNKYPGKDFKLVVGADNYEKITQWKNYDEVVKLAELIWVDRPGFDKPKNTVKCGSALSSSHIRKMFSLDMNVKGYVDDEVTQYIRKYRLY